MKKALISHVEQTQTPPTATVDASAFVAAVLVHVAVQCSLQIAEITTNTRRRAVVRARSLVSYAAVRNAGLPARQVAPLLGISPRTVLDGVALAERRFPADALAHPHLQPPRRSRR